MSVLESHEKNPSIVGSNNSGGSTVSDLDHPLKDKQTDTYNYKNDPKNPLNWSKRKKYIEFTVVGMNAFMGYFSSAIYIPATTDILNTFDTTITIINATIALFLLINGIAPLFWAPLSERVGRRWIYIISMALYTVCTVICGISKNIGTFFAFRMLQSIFASTGQALGSGTASDLFEPQDRGKATSFYILGTILGPAVGPLVGGYVDQYLGWRWIFYIMTIMGGVLTILNFIFVYETLYTPHPQPPPANFKERLDRLKFNPFGSFKFLLLPDVILCCIPISVSFGWYFMMVTLIPKSFGPIYNFSTGSVGLCFLANGIGNIAGSLLAGYVSDTYYKRSVKDHNGEVVSEYRLKPIFFGVPLMVVGCVLYGWFLHAKLFWIGPLIVMAIACIGIMYTITITNAYLVDCYLSNSASVVSANNFTRNLSGMVFSLLGVTIRDSLGDGWTFTLMSLLCLISYVICVPIVLKYSAQWRSKHSL